MRSNGKNNVEIAELAERILRDLESNSVPIELIIAKALRLAQVTGDLKTVEWLNYEIHGYRTDTEVGKNYAQLMGRWNGKDASGIFGAAGALRAVLESFQTLIEAQKEYKPSGTYAHAHHINRMEQLTSYLGQTAPIEKIFSSLRAYLHLFASRVINEAKFSETSRSIFEKYQLEIDSLLAATASDAFAKLPQVFERLENGEGEAVSHALTSCRRIFDAFADAIFPPRSEPVQISDQSVDCGKGKPRNQIRAYIFLNTQSKSRVERLTKNATLLYDRLSTAVHADVSLDEARALVLNTYLFLGEILSLKASQVGM